MSDRDLTIYAELLAVAAAEAVEEEDVIQRRPEVVDALHDLAERSDFPDVFANRNGHDPAAYARALGDALVPFQHEPLSDAPELVEGLVFIAQALRQATNGNQAVPARA